MRRSSNDTAAESISPRPGGALLPFAAEAELLFENARRAVQDGREPSGRLALGSLETTAALRLPPVLVEFARVCPRVDVSVQTGNSEALIEAVAERRLEGAFVAGPVDHPGLVDDSVLIEQLVLVTAPGLSPDALADAELKVLVFRQGCSFTAGASRPCSRPGGARATAPSSSARSTASSAA